ncbi:MAG: hypothetical protein H0W15_04835 [Gemmatimonadales bacterium]|nr:hypothetical protein [Gemmatimonadales bacterium]
MDSNSAFACTGCCSGRLEEFFHDPQRFLDQVAAILAGVLENLLVDTIQYARVTDSARGGEWEMRLFAEEELVDYLTSLEVRGSVYDRIPYDLEIEREFARQLDERDDIRLFVKLPRWFTVDTPLGGYNSDWAILKEDGKALYLARETKGTRATPRPAADVSRGGLTVVCHK